MHGLLHSGYGRDELCTPAELEMLGPDGKQCCNYNCTEKAEFGVEHRGLMSWYCSKCFNLITMHMLERDPYEGSC